MAETSVPTAMDSRRERTESARLDNFVDGAFAFAITLLVISGASLPKNVAALEHALRGVPAFAACFAQLAWFWHAHVHWRDNVRLTDKRSLLLSLLLVFFALVFVFPLHLVYAGMFNGASGGALSPDVAPFARETEGVAALFVCYGLSYACMAGTLAALYRHGARTATWMARKEAVSVRVWGAIWGYVAAVGLLSALLALALPTNPGWVNGLPGFSYFLLGLIGPMAHYYRNHLEATLPP
ncbi:MAG TPA: TMEM175 family protein [Rhodanobacteraceae bacterium]|nr:TMEM175 family protein [Rhodanobacteraceae bacterium]